MAIKCTELIIEEVFSDCNISVYQKWNQKAKCCLGRESAECTFSELHRIKCAFLDPEAIKEEIFNRYEDIHKNNCYDYQNIRGCYIPLIDVILLMCLIILCLSAVIIYIYIYIRPKPKEEE